MPHIPFRPTLDQIDFVLSSDLTEDSFLIKGF